MKNRKNILSIAGFDPSGGAGSLADTKTFEQHKTLGFSVQTTNTIQTEDEFISANWIEKSLVLNQLEILLKKYRFQVVKIGLIHDFDFLIEIQKRLFFYQKSTKIVWDPVLSSSTGFTFHKDFTSLSQILENCFIVTPNWNEAVLLFGNNNPLIGSKEFSKHGNIYLKGGHNETLKGKDYLFHKSGKEQNFNPKKGVKAYEKHGSGCVFSSSLAANILKGYPLQKACLKSKTYTARFLSSSSGLLGHHNF